MKKLFLVVMIAVLSGCTSANQYGKCVGLNGHENPKLEYEYNAWNIGMGVLFSGLIVPPIIVVLDELKCPVGEKVNP